ncbi:hypothetical protein GP486_008704, partial [Trichoglossum hirsutum]
GVSVVYIYPSSDCGSEANMSTYRSCFRCSQREQLLAVYFRAPSRAKVHPMRVVPVAWTGSLTGLPYDIPGRLARRNNSNSDLSEILAQFFDWLIYRSNEQQRESLEHIKDRLLDEDWNLDTLRDERKGGAMTTAIWESYGFKLGTLANIRCKISEFKRQRHQRPRSRDSNNGS